MGYSHRVFTMKYKLRYKSVLTALYHSVIYCLCFMLFALIPIIALYFLFIAIAAVFSDSIMLNYFSKFVFILEILTALFIALCSNKRYIKISSKGILIHNGNTIHFGLRQQFRFNTMVSFDRIKKCYIEIPIDCPKTYSYLIYKKFGGNDEYFDYIRKAGIIKTKEPALADGRYDEKCILLELDNKRIIVIPIDECEKFLELFNQYIEKYNELQKAKEKEN